MIPSTVVRSSALMYMGRINSSNHLTRSVNRVSGALKFFPESRPQGRYKSEFFFQNGKFYVLCKVVDDCKLAPGTRKVELFVLPYRNGF